MRNSLGYNKDELYYHLKSVTRDSEYILEKGKCGQGSCGCEFALHVLVRFASPAASLRQG